MVHIVLGVKCQMVYIYYSFTFLFPWKLFPPIGFTLPISIYTHTFLILRIVMDMDIMYIIPLRVHSHWHWWVMQKVSNDQRGRLLMTTERLNQSTDRIKESRRTMLETEELGVSILQNLHQQRQSLLHANNTVCLTLFLFVPINGSLPLGHRFIVVITFYILYVSFLYFMFTTLHPSLNGNWTTS